MAHNQEDARRLKRAERFAGRSRMPNEIARRPAWQTCGLSKAFAPVHPSINDYKRGNADSMLGLGAGRLRDYGVDHYATQRGKTYLPVDNNAEARTWT